MIRSSKSYRKKLYGLRKALGKMFSNAEIFGTRHYSKCGSIENGKSAQVCGIYTVVYGCSEQDRRSPGRFVLSTRGSRGGSFIPPARVTEWVADQSWHCYFVRLVYTSFAGSASLNQNQSETPSRRDEVFLCTTPPAVIIRPYRYLTRIDRSCESRQLSARSRVRAPLATHDSSGGKM